MIKKVFAIFCSALAAFCCLNFAACNKKTQPIVGSGTTRDDNAWFTEEELNAKHLSGLPAPTGLTGKISSDVHWFGDGYSFSQPCPDEATFTANAQTYFDYFKTNYARRFGKPRIEKLSSSMDETWYKIEQKNQLEDYHSANPSSLYEFYVVTDDTPVDGYFKDGAVLKFEIRYEQNGTGESYYFKLFIENASTTRNGTFKNYYKMN